MPEKEFAQAEPQLAEGLLELRRELLADPVLADRVRRKYAIRNTHGLRLCALLDGETPLEIFRRLLVGSEGTLAFIAEAVLETIPTPRVTSVAWIPVPTIDEAIALVPGLVGLGASAVELMVAPALTAAGQAFDGNARLLENSRSQSRCPARRDWRREPGLSRSNTTPSPRSL